MPVAARTAGLSNQYGALTHSITPSLGGASGDLLLVAIATCPNAATASTTSTGWSLVAQPDAASGTSVAVFAGIAGTAAATLTVSTSSYVTSAWSAVRITGWSGSISDIQVAGATGNSATPDPPALTPTLGTREYVWWVVCGMNARQSTTAPANYGALQLARASGEYAGNVSIVSADRTSTGSTENPGTFTGASAADTWDALTIAIPPSVMVGSDQLTLADTASVTSTTPTTSDQLTLAESAAIRLPAVEQLTLTDAATVRATTPTSGDLLALTESGSMTSTTPTTSDALTLTDSAVMSTVFAGTPDQLTLTESAGLRLVGADEVTLTESATVTATTPTSGDVLALTESAAIRLPAADQLTLTDAALLALRDADTLTLADTAQMITALTAGDTLTLAESARIIHHASDQLTLVDYARLAVSGVRLAGRNVITVPAGPGPIRVPPAPGPIRVT